MPVATTRSNDASRAATSRSRPYSFSGISSRSGTSCSASGNSSMRPRVSHSAQAPPKIVLDAGGGLVALLGGLGEQLHDKPGNRRRDGL